MDTADTHTGSPTLPAKIEIEGDSPEAVALALFREIVASDPQAGRHDGRLQGNALLDLYAQCLRTVRHPGSRLDGATGKEVGDDETGKDTGSFPVPEIGQRR